MIVGDESDEKFLVAHVKGGVSVPLPTCSNQRITINARRAALQHTPQNFDPRRIAYKPAIFGLWVLTYQND